MEEQNRMLPDLIVVLGPTASGKSALGIALAQQNKGEIISADSRQVYRGLDIGSAKVSAEEQALIPHHLLDITDPQEIYTVAQFQQDAIRAIDTILERGKQPFLVGGSPHYIQTIVEHFDIPHIEPQPELRAQLAKRPLIDLLTQLEELDPESARTIDRNNPRRIQRALEVCIVSGQPFSQQRRVARARYRTLELGIHWPRDILYQRIDQRVDERMKQGMEQEVRELLAHGVSRERLEEFGLEYRFVSRWIHKDFASEGEMVQRLKYAIHDFTRRQISWFRRDPGIIWIEGGETTVAEASQHVQTFRAHSNNQLIADQHESATSFSQN